jgi:CRISPR-associated DxTHG motif protein
VQPGEELYIDVTHGFRHLPMLALVAARYLARVVGVKVQELYYGALEMTTPEGETPVLRLGGLLAMLDWVDALASYDKDGDYGAFAPLLAADGMEKGRADLLARAAYFERTNNPVKARETLNSVFPSVEAHRGALGELFGETLAKRISWFRRADARRLGTDARRRLPRARRLPARRHFHVRGFRHRACNVRRVNPNDFRERDEAITPAPGRRSRRSGELEYLRNAWRTASARVRRSGGAHPRRRSALRAALKSLRKELFQP